MMIETQSLMFGAAKRSLVETASQVAFVAHTGQTRKDSGSPYVIHPYMTALKLARHGFSETVAAAAIVHDVLEDTGVTEDQLRELLGEEVVTIVRALTEDKSLVWEKRKELYIESIRNAPDAVKAVSIADKIHNLESLLAAHAVQGPAVWKLFNRGRESKAWFEHTLLSAVQATWSHPLVDEYAQLVLRMDGLE